jgi:hypothetical protein
MPMIVVDVCANFFAEFDEHALAAVLGQVRRRDGERGLLLTALGFTGSAIHDRCRTRPNQF